MAMVAVLEERKIRRENRAQSRNESSLSVQVAFALFPGFFSSLLWFCPLLTPCVSRYDERLF
jgi:hypothetical protein